jgi:cholesterol oxidase
LLDVLDSPQAAAAAAPLVMRLIARWLLRRPERDLSAELSALLGSTALSGGLLPLLGMGRDVPDGVMSLVDGKLDIEWKLAQSRPYFDRLRGQMRAIADELGATYVDNPTWHLSRVITVHALGGCPMGRSADEGVVDTWGRVFNYPDLYVADGAVMPGPVGANPSLTIAALADRFADGIIETRGRAA